MLSNFELIDINQDPLGKQASLLSRDKHLLGIN